MRLAEVADEVVASIQEAHEQMVMIHEEAAELGASAVQLIDNAVSLLTFTPTPTNSTASAASTAPASAHRQRTVTPLATHGRLRPQSVHTAAGIDVGSRMAYGGGESDARRGEPQREPSVTLGVTPTQDLRLAQMDATIGLLQQQVAEIAAIVRRGVASVSCNVGVETSARAHGAAAAQGGVEEAGARLRTAETDIHILADKVESIRASRSPDPGAQEAAQSERALQSAREEAADAQRKLSLLREWVARNWPVGGMQVDDDELGQNLRETDFADTPAGGGAIYSTPLKSSALAREVSLPASRPRPPKMSASKNSAADKVADSVSRRRSPDTPTVDGGPLGEETSQKIQPRGPEFEGESPATISPLSRTRSAELSALARGAVKRGEGKDVSAARGDPPSSSMREVEVGFLNHDSDSSSPVATLQGPRSGYRDSRDTEMPPDADALDQVLTSAARGSGGAATVPREGSGEYSEEPGDEAVPDDHTLLYEQGMDDEDESFKDSVQEYFLAAPQSADMAAGADGTRTSADVATSAQLRQHLQDGDDEEKRMVTVTLGGGAFMLDGPLGIGRRHVRLRGMRDAAVIGRMILENEARGSLRTLKIVNLPAAPPPSIGTPLTPPTLRSWVRCMRASVFVLRATPLNNMDERRAPMLGIPLRHTPSTQTRTCAREHARARTTHTHKHTHSHTRVHTHTHPHTHFHTHSRTHTQMQACVLVWGGPWQVECCEVRSSGGSVCVCCMRG